MSKTLFDQSYWFRPSPEDWHYFQSFPGHQLLIRGLHVSFEQFVQASIDFQRSDKLRWSEFKEVEAKFVRDKLLWDNYRRPVGMIFLSKAEIERQSKERGLSQQQIVEEQWLVGEDHLKTPKKREKVIEVKKSSYPPSFLSSSSLMH